MSRKVSKKNSNAVAKKGRIEVRIDTDRTLNNSNLSKWTYNSDQIS